MRILTQFARSLTQNGRLLRAALLAQDCFLCAAPSGDALLCSACSNDLPTLPATGCPLCAQPTPTGAVCGACLKRPPYFDATVARFRYTFPLDRLIHALKYRHQLTVARCLADALLETAPRLPPADLLMTVPLAERRLKGRGFNQAVEIARPLARQLDLPLLIGGYAKTLDVVPQARLPWKERARNIRGAFECALDLRDKRVIVIDDVMTTGATLNEFARTLKKHGAAHVTNWVVARAYKD